MADGLHPHWQTTDAHAVPEVSAPQQAHIADDENAETVRVHGPAPLPQRATGSTVSRRPAAFVGIAIALTVGITAMTAGNAPSDPLAAQAPDYTQRAREAVSSHEEPLDMAADPDDAVPEPMPRETTEDLRAPVENTVPETITTPSAPIPENTNTAGAAPQSSALHSGAPPYKEGPFKQPETGGWTMAWAAASSLGGLLILQRRVLR